MMEKEPARILLIDDDRVIRKMYADILRKDGFAVKEEASAVDALERLVRGQLFDLIITDIMMAKMDGWELLEVIRKTLCMNSVKLPVIVMSAHFDSATLRAEAMRRGASATYMKTEPLSRLLHETRIHTGRARSRFDDDTIPD